MERKTPQPIDRLIESPEDPGYDQDAVDRGVAPGYGEDVDDYGEIYNVDATIESFLTRQLVWDGFDEDGIKVASTGGGEKVSVRLDDEVSLETALKIRNYLDDIMVGDGGFSGKLKGEIRQKLGKLNTQRSNPYYF